VPVTGRDRCGRVYSATALSGPAAARSYHRNAQPFTISALQYEPRTRAARRLAQESGSERDARLGAKAFQPCASRYLCTIVHKLRASYCQVMVVNDPAYVPRATTVFRPLSPPSPAEAGRLSRAQRTPSAGLVAAALQWLRAPTVVPSWLLAVLLLGMVGTTGL